MPQNDTSPTPIWTDERIRTELTEHSAAHKNDWNAAYALLCKMSSDYEAKLRDYQAVYLYYIDLAEKMENDRAQAAARIAELEAQLAALHARNVELFDRIKVLTSDPESLAAQVDDYREISLEWQRLTRAAVEKMEAAQAQLAAAGGGGWEDVPEGEYQTELEVVTIGDNFDADYPLYLRIDNIDGNSASCGLPEDWRLQRRVDGEKGVE